MLIMQFYHSCVGSSVKRAQWSKTVVTGVSGPGRCHFLSVRVLIGQSVINQVMLRLCCW